MSCGHCASKVEGALNGLGVSAKVNLKDKSVDVNFDESKVTLEAIKATIKDKGYEVV
ncbi:Copper chaperone CopZ [compost metagenome]